MRVRVHECMCERLCVKTGESNIQSVRCLCICSKILEWLECSMWVCLTERTECKTWCRTKSSLCSHHAYIQIGVGRNTTYAIHLSIHICHDNGSYRYRHEQCAVVSITQWLYVLVQMCRLGRERISCWYARLCAFDYFEHQKRHEITSTNSVGFYYKMRAKQKKKIFLILPPLHTNRAPQAVAWNGKSTRFFFSLLFALLFVGLLSCVELWVSRIGYVWLVLHNVGKRSQCRCMSTSRNRTRNFYVRILFYFSLIVTFSRRSSWNKKIGNNTFL